MKRRIEKPNDNVMKFFTPGLYLQFNSSDNDDADCADEAWEEAIQKYRQHLVSISDRMSVSIRQIAKACFHDAELLAVDTEVETPPFLNGSQSPFWLKVAILSLRQGEEVTTLVYYLWDKTREIPAPKNWPFSREQLHWLYDELDMAPAPAGFRHRILLSDGRILDIPFVEVVMHRFSLQPVTVVA